MPYDFGDVVLVPFPFTSQAASKRRLAVVVSSPAYNASKPDIVVMAVTSQLRASALLGEVWLQDWHAAQLLKPSAVKPVLATLEQVTVIRRFGRLSADDLSSLKNAIRQIIG
jgi:mRNA interferase MazF